MAKGKKRLEGKKQRHSEKAVRKVPAAEREAIGKEARLEEKPSARFTMVAENGLWRVRLDHPNQRIGSFLSQMRSGQPTATL